MITDMITDDRVVEDLLKNRLIVRAQCESETLRLTFATGEVLSIEAVGYGEAILIMKLDPGANAEKAYAESVERKPLTEEKRRTAMWHHLLRHYVHD